MLAIFEWTARWRSAVTALRRPHHLQRDHSLAARPPTRVRPGPRPRPPGQPRPLGPPPGQAGSHERVLPRAPAPSGAVSPGLFRVTASQHLVLFTAGSQWCTVDTVHPPPGDGHLVCAQLLARDPGRGCVSPVLWGTYRKRDCWPLGDPPGSGKPRVVFQRLHQHLLVGRGWLRTWRGARGAGRPGGCEAPGPGPRPPRGLICTALTIGGARHFSRVYCWSLTPLRKRLFEPSARFVVSVGGGGSLSSAEWRASGPALRLPLARVAALPHAFSCHCWRLSRRWGDAAV